MAATDDTPRTPHHLGLRARARVHRPRPPARRLRAVHRRRVRRPARRAPRAVDQPRHRGAGGRGRLRRRGRRRRRRGRRPRRPAQVGEAARAASARSTSSASRASSRSARASWRWSSRSTAASRSASRATSTSRWPPRTSSTTPAGPTSCGYGVAGRKHEPHGRRRADRAVELPAADGRLEARARARVRQRRDPQAGRDDAADGAAAGRDLPGGRAARRRGRTSSPATASPAPRSCAREVDKVAFTGSTAVGKDIQAALAGRGVGLTLELGGKSANIVFEDAAIDQAVEGIVQGIFFNQGHVCCAGSRLLIQESVAEEVTAKLWDRMRLLRVGDPLDKNTDVGAINSAEQLERIEALVAAGEEEGAVRRHASPATCPSAAGGSPRRSSPTSRPPTASRSRRSSARWSRC